MFILESPPGWPASPVSGLDASIFQKEECDIPRVDEADPEAVEKARRFARIIVSDIALYNQEAVIEGLKNGTFYDLLRKDIEEGLAREILERTQTESALSRSQMNKKLRSQRTTDTGLRTTD